MRLQKIFLHLQKISVKTKTYKGRLCFDKSDFLQLHLKKLSQSLPNSH